MTRDESFSKPERKSEERPSYKYRYSFEVRSYEPEELSQDDKYWISITPELSERSSIDLDTSSKSPFILTPHSTTSRISFGANTSILSEAKGLWSSKDRQMDRLMLEEVLEIRQLSESRWLQVDQAKNF